MNQEEEIAVRYTTAVQMVHGWDEEEIVDLYRSGGWWKEEYRADELRHLIRGSFLFAIATDEKTGRAIGMGRVISDGVSDGYIQDLVVLPGYRKSGIGSRIVSLLVKKCRESGLTWIALIAEPDSDAFYSSLGFQKMKDFVPMIYQGDL